jgi:cell division protein FtsZ
MIDAFKKADEVLLNAVQGISDLINHTGLINSDFADVRTIMQNKGLALMGIGHGEGEHRAVEAATNAISSPLLEDVSIEGATGIIINITGSSSLSINEVNEATTLIMEAAHEDAEIIFGTVIDESLKDTVKVTVIATGLASSGVELQRADTLLQQSQAQVAQPPAFNPQAFSAQVQQTQVNVAREQQPIAQEPPSNLPFQAPAVETAPVHVAAPQPLQSAEVDSAELARARAIAQRLGITNLTDDSYDIPTYMRRQQEREV